MIAKSAFIALALLPGVLRFSSASSHSDDTTRRPSAATLVAQLDTALQDEYHAEQVYQRVLADHGEIRPFANVVHAEARHAAHLAALLQARGVAVPSSRWNADNVPRFGTIQAACAGAAEAEVANIAMYDRFLAQELPDDVRQVLAQNRWASVERHLPAFNRCR